MSSSSTTFVLPVPEGQYPPFAVVTDTDHSAWIIIATTVGLACSIIFAGIRAFIRSTICPGIGLDDAFLAASTVLAIFQSSVLLAACSNGFGKSIELIPGAIHSKVQELYYAGSLLFIIALGLSKLSVVCLLLRLTVVQLHRRLFVVVGILIAAWTLGSLFAVALQCNLAHPWIIADERCSGAFLRWQVICALDIIFEITLVGMSTLLVWDLQTSWKTKNSVVVTFAFRLLMIIPIGFRLSTFETTGRTSDPTLNEVLFAVWTQTELNYSLIAATIPSLRPFTNNLNTQFGGLGVGESAYAYGFSRQYDDNTHSENTYQMTDLRPHDKTDARDESGVAASVPQFTGKPKSYSYDVWVPGTIIGSNKSRAGEKGATSKQGQPIEEQNSGDATSVGSNDSQKMIIRKEMTFKIEHRVSK